MNEIQTRNFIRLTLKLARSEIKRLGDMVDDEFDGIDGGDLPVIAEIDHALALLPPEGETRPKHDMLFIDATPDDGYIARILSAYIDDSYYSDNTAGLPPSNPLVVKMNEWREQRNVLLRSALARLAEPTPSSEKALREAAVLSFCTATCKEWCNSMECRDKTAFSQTLDRLLASSSAPEAPK